MLDLNDLIDPDDPLSGDVTLVFAVDINNNGQILSKGVKGEEAERRFGNYLVTPIPQVNLVANVFIVGKAKIRTRW